MRRCLAAFVTLSFIAAANVSAADIPFPGSTVFIPPLLNENSPAEIPPSTRVMRLPPQAGLVRNVITTNLLKKGPSWIAFGDKYISLCAPNRLRVACSPVAATATMRDIHIRAYAGGNNEAYVAYDVRPKTTRSAAEVFVATDYFQKRLAKKVAHFKGKIQDNERIPVGGDGVSYEDKAIACQAMYEFEMDECKAYSRAADVRMRIACQSKAADRNAECLTTARRTSRIAV